MQVIHPEIITRRASNITMREKKNQIILVVVVVVLVVVIVIFLYALLFCDVQFDGYTKRREKTRPIYRDTFSNDSPKRLSVCKGGQLRNGETTFSSRYGATTLNSSSDIISIQRHSSAMMDSNHLPNDLKHIRTWTGRTLPDGSNQFIIAKCQIDKCQENA